MRRCIVHRCTEVLVSSLLVLVVACAPPASTPTSPPKVEPTKPAPVAAKATEVARPPAKADWEVEWEQVLAAAKSEGTVAVTGPAGNAARDSLTEPFQKAYGISVEYFAGPGREITPRVSIERAAGQFLWDIYVGGTTTGLVDLIPLGAFDPLESALILPDVKDPKTWRSGGLEFVDDSRALLVMTPHHQGKLFINTNLVRLDEFKTYRDLLDPKWKGKIVADDPRRPGPGQATFMFFYLHPDLGPEFIRALATQELTLLQDLRQELDLLGRGQYPVLLGATDDQAEAFISTGVPIDIVPATQLKELTDINPAAGAVALYNRRPHPNAARIYLHWLLSKEGQTEFARKQGVVSSRLDVPTDHARPWRVPLPGAIKTYDQKAVAVQQPLLSLLRETFSD
jgi:iron(III) transport system substrate-binding protein